MNNTVFFPALGQLETVEVYEYYDEPVLYTAKNILDELFLVILASDSENVRTWLYVPMSKRRFLEVRSGGIELRHAFLSAESGYVFSLKYRKDNAELSTGEWLPTDSLMESCIPASGERLNLPTETIVHSDVPDVVRIARQINKEVMTIVLDFGTQNRSEAPVEILGKFLSCLQQIVYAVGHTLLGRETVRARFSQDIRQQMQLAVVNVFAGSFGIELHSSEESDLFGDACIRHTLDKVLLIFQSTSSEEDLIDILKDIRGHSAEKYKDFLGHFGGELRKVNVQWGSPISGQIRSASITSEDAAKAREAIIRIEPEAPDEYLLHAQLVGINVRTKSFEIFELEEEKKYAGRILDEAMSSCEHATINDVYYVRIREETEITITGDIKVKYKLIHLSDHAE